MLRRIEEPNDHISLSVESSDPASVPASSPSSSELLLFSTVPQLFAARQSAQLRDEQTRSNTVETPGSAAVRPKFPTSGETNEAAETEGTNNEQQKAEEGGTLQNLRKLYPTVFVMLLLRLLFASAVSLVDMCSSLRLTATQHPQS